MKVRSAGISLQGVVYSYFREDHDTIGLVSEKARDRGRRAKRAKSFMDIVGFGNLETRPWHAAYLQHNSHQNQTSSFCVNRLSYGSLYLI